MSNMPPHRAIRDIQSGYWLPLDGTGHQELVLVHREAPEQARTLGDGYFGKRQKMRSLR